MTTDDGPLRGPYRVLRAVRAREDAPWPGVLVRATGGASHVLVDAVALGPDWAGWTASPDGHVLAPIDIARRRDGHDLVLPVCLERLEEFVRRREMRMPFTPGEAVTLGVSVLRGCAQIAAEPATTGEWWLDDAGRPLLATDASPARALDAGAAVLEKVTVEPVLQRTWDTALRAVRAERVSARELAAAEDALFAIAAAEPLSTVTLSPRTAAEGARTREAPDGHGSVTVHEPAPRSMWQSLLIGVDEDLADTVSRATTAVWRRLRPRDDRPRQASSRRAPWLLGGAVAVAVLAGGALWPAAGETTTDDTVAAQATGAPTASPAPAAGVGEPDAAPGDAAAGPVTGETEAAADSAAPVEAAPLDLAAVTADLLDARLGCAGDAHCLHSVLLDPAAVTGGAIDLPSSERAITMLDDFGDLAVLRVDANGGEDVSQLVVVVRQDQKWLLRDVHDVAQQP